MLVRSLSPLAGHPRLSRLTISSCENLRSLTQLGKMPALKKLYLPSRNQFTDKEVDDFRRNNPQCQINPQW